MRLDGVDIRLQRLTIKRMVDEASSYDCCAQKLLVVADVSKELEIARYESCAQYPREKVLSS